MCHEEPYIPMSPRDGMEQPIQDFFFTKSRFWTKVNESVLDIAYDEARRKLESQMADYRHITRTSSVFLGWMVGGIISLSAAIVVLFPGGWSVSLIMAVYALAMLIVPSAIVIFGIQFNQRNREPGVEPRIALRDGTCFDLLDIDEACQARNYKVALLMGTQDAIDDNERENEQRIACYHLAVWIFIAEIIIGILIFCLLSAKA